MTPAEALAASLRDQAPGAAKPVSVARRTVDMAVSLIGLVITAIVFPVIAFAIKLDSKGPIFYHQDRAGLGGQLFTLWKFRSMVLDADNESWTLEGDPRITRVGRWLRRSHLDELPQFWNVLRGEMTLIGPRPERPSVLVQLQADDPAQSLRLTAVPGLTSLSAVTRGYVATPEAARERLHLDLDYIRDRSLMLDLRILAASFVEVVTLGGR
jgi:lipopolysaccharide/colanic/teichoic acid biosynthesis glycosyltransferase